ncbi:hypothetical protein F5I97DRAFT_436838 [Phlebopus sp. FC_14]|nr:hypothetical protein F5I97DRAFT_436838 [Phlebopus sp. FC_14]
MMTPEQTSPSNPFASPMNAVPKASPAKVDIQAHQDNVLATACLLLEQLRELETICATTEDRVQHKRLALKDLENLVSEPSRTGDISDTPACPTNTPVSHRFIRFKSPRLHGLFDLRGPGRINPESIQSAADYSPEYPVQESPPQAEEHKDGDDEWVDDDEQAPLYPFGDEHAYNQEQENKGSPKTPGKEDTPLLAYEQAMALAANMESESQPLLQHLYATHTDSPVSRKTDTSRVLARKSSNRRHPSVRCVKAFESASDVKTKGTMRRASWKRSIMAKGGPRRVSQNDGEGAKEQKKGRWSIYSVCSELGMNARHRG